MTDAEQERADAALRESEARSRLLIESWAQAVWEADPDGVVVEDSPSWRAYTGQTVEEWLGYGWLDAVHPEDRAYAERQWREKVAARELVDAEFRLRAPDGGWRWTNVRAAPMLDVAGNVEKWLGLNIDIDDRRRAEAARRESEERYRTLFETMDEAYAVVEVLKDDDGRWSDFRFLEVNRAFLKHTTMPWPVGKTATELLGSPNPRWTELYGEALDTGMSLRVEEAEATLGLTFSLNIFTLDREKNCVAVLFTNVTQQKQAEDALRSSEERLRQFGDASQDVLWIRDAETLQWNYLTPAFETIYGISRDEALSGDNYHNWVELIVPEDREYVTEMIRRVRQGEHVTFEYRVRRPIDGEIRWLRNTDFPITDEHGKVVLIGGIGHDATDLHEAEQRFRSLLEGIPQLLWRAVDGGHWTWASPQWTQFTGQAEADSHGFGWLECVHPDDRDAAMTAWSHAVEAGGFSVEYRLCHADEGYSWFSTRARPVRDDGGAIVEWLGTSTDIQNLRQLQDRQRILLAELQHRVRNIMAMIRSIARRTSEGPVTVDDYIEHFEGRINAMARTQTLLTRAPGTGVDLQNLLRDELEAQAARPIQYSCRGPDIALSAKAAEVLTLAVHELATNAIKYGALGVPDGLVTIEWSKECRGDRDWLRFDWTELRVTIPPDAGKRQGFGTELVTRRVPYELKGSGSIEFRPTGLHAHIEFPLVPGQSILQTDPGQAVGTVERRRA